MNIAYVTKRQALAKRIKEMESELKEMDEVIKDEVGVDNEIIIGPFTIRLKTQTRKEVDKKKLQALHPEIYDEVEKEISFPRLTIT